MGAMTRRPFSYAQRGNILFLILLAIILFVALSYAITSQRDGGKSISSEKANSLAATTMQYLTLASNSVQRMVLNGVRVGQLDFQAPSTVAASLSANTSCTTLACRVFDLSGGGVTPMPLSGQATDTSLSQPYTTAGESKFSVFYQGVKDVGSDLPEILFLYRAVKKDVCQQINIVSGVQTGADNIPVDASGSSPADYVAFAGTMDPLPVLNPNDLGNGDARIAGKRTFCVDRAGSGYYLYHVLLAQ